MKIAFATMDTVGHLNPALALASKLMQRGHHCRFFLGSAAYEDDILKLGTRTLSNANHLDICRVYEGGDNGDMSHAGLVGSVPPHADQPAGDLKCSDILMGMLNESAKQMPKFLLEVRRYDPDLIVYDPFMINPCVAAYILNLPCASTITFPDFNSYPIFMGRHSEEDKLLALAEHKVSETISKVRNWYFEKYSFDIFSNVIPSHHMLPKGLNICTGVEAFAQAMPRAVADVYEGMDRDCLYVGPMLLAEKDGRVSGNVPQEKSEQQDEKDCHGIDAPFPKLSELRKLKRQGKKIVYVSFGTVATGFFWDYEAPQSKMFGGRQTGKDFCRTLWRRIFEAFEGRRDYVVVMATVSEDPKALEGLDIPKNFIVRRRCPQLDVLKVADVFITHGGANSMMESITAGVPMLVLPYFADQFSNAEIISREGVGLHYLDPVAECTAFFIISDVETLQLQRPKFSGNCSRLDRLLKSAGSSDKAVREIEKYVAAFQGHEITKRQMSFDVDYLNCLLQRCNTGSWRDMTYSREASFKYPATSDDFDPMQTSGRSLSDSI